MLMKGMVSAIELLDGSRRGSSSKPVRQCRLVVEAAFHGGTVEKAPLKLLYTAPPIIEVSLQIAFSDPQDEHAMRKVSQTLKRGYRNTVASTNSNATIDFENRSAVFDDTSQFRLSSSDETDVLTITPDALTWSRSAPYEGWDQIYKRMERDFLGAIAAGGYRKASRLGVRYINRLDIPHTGDLILYEEYLNLNISIPPEWTAIQNYAWRIERGFDPLYAIIQSTIVKPEIPGTGAFLLDIDVIAQKDLPARPDDVLSRFESMRNLKNTIFELSISDKARGQFSL
jgi:uncharacterized protein (TIGR04255 family)